MTYKFGTSDTEYFNETLSCIINVVEDYSMSAAFASYYAEGNDKYFNIVAYDSDNNRVSGFTITVGNDEYTLGYGNYETLITFPEDYSESVWITRTGYIPYELKNEYLSASNTIMMYPETDGEPTVMSVWMRKATESDYRNVRLETLMVTEGSLEEYVISYEADWAGSYSASMFLIQGNKQVVLGSGQNTVALGEYFTADGGTVYLGGYTANGYQIKVPLRITVQSEVSQTELDFGDSVSETISKELDGIGGDKIKFDLTSTVPISYVINSDGSVTGTIGIRFKTKAKEKDIYSLSEEISNTEKKLAAAEKKGDTDTAKTLTKDLKKKIEKQNNALESKEKSWGKSASITYIGCFDGRMNNGQVEIKNLSLILDVNVSAVYMNNFYLVTVPAQWKFTFKEDLELVLKTGSGTSGEIDVKMPQLTSTTKLEGVLSAGAIGLVEVAATATGKLKYQFASGALSDSVWKAGVDFSLGPKVLGSKSYEWVKFDDYDDVQIYPKESAASLASVEEKVCETYTVSAYTANDDETEGTGYVETQTIKTATYQDSQPQLVNIDDRNLLVWVDTDTERDAKNQGRLYYSVYENGAWSDPKAIGADSYVDMSPTLKVLDGTVYLVWQKANQSFAESTEYTDQLKALDIYMSYYDTETGEWSDPICVHGSNEALDSLPQIQKNGDELSIIWVQTEDISEEIPSSIIKKSVYDSENGWEEEAIRTIDGWITGLAYSGDGIVYYATEDNIYSLGRSSTACLTESDTLDSNPKIYNDTLYWMSDNTITDGNISIPLETATSDYAVYTLDDDGYTVVVYYGSDDHGEQQLYATYGKGSIWGEPVALTEERDVIFCGLDGYCDSSQQLRIATNCYEDFQANLKITTVKNISNLETASMDYLGTTLQSGGNLTADVLIENTGNTVIGTVTASLGNITSITSKVDLYPGQSTYIELSIPVDSLTEAENTVTVVPTYLKDANAEDNTITVEIPSADLSVENVSAQTNGDGSTHVSAMLVNRGLQEISDVTISLMKDSEDGTVLDTIELTEILEVGETTYVSFDTKNLSVGDMAYIVAGLDTSENYDSNNIDCVLIEEMLKDDSIIELKPDFSEDEIELNTEYSFSLTEEESTCLFTPEKDGYYILYVEGMMSDVGDTVPEIFISVDDRSYQWSNGESNTDNNTWTQEAYLYLELEAETTYTLGLSGTSGVICTIRMKEAPLPESVTFKDWKLEEFQENVYNTINAVTTPDFSVDTWEFTSSDPTVGGVSPNYNTNVVLGLNPGKTTVTAKGKYSGLVKTFTIEVSSNNKGEIREGEKKEISPDEGTDGIYYFTPSENGYYTVFEGNSFCIWSEKSTNYEYKQDGYAVYMEAGVRYSIKAYSGTLCVQRLEPTEAELYTSYESNCYESGCNGVLLYRYTPEEDMVISASCRNYSSCNYIKLYDENYQLIAETEVESGVSRFNLYSVLKKGETYYIAYEHTWTTDVYIGKVELSVYGPYSGYVGETGNYSYYLDSDAEVTWNTSDESIATVNQEGVVTYLKEGSVDISVSAYDGALTAYRSVDVNEKYTLQLNESVTIPFDSYVTAKMEFTPKTSGEYYFIMNMSGNYYMYDLWIEDEEENWIEYERENQSSGTHVTCTLEAGNTYAFYFEYMKDTENDNFVLTAKITDVLAITAPDAVTATVSMASAASAKVSWTASDEADGYIILRSTSKSGTYSRIKSVSSGTLSYIDTGLTYGQTYYYKVVAYKSGTSDDLYSDDSDIVSVALKLSKPTLSSVANISSGVKVTWNKETGAGGYYVYRKTSSGSWTKIGTVKSGSTVTYTDTSAKAGTTYVYTVEAFYGSNVSSYNTTGLTIRRLTNPAVTLTNTSSGVKVSWKKIAGASGYYVYRKTSSGSYAKIKTISSGSTVNYTDTSASNGTTYIYKVVAKYSSYTSFYSAKTMVRLSRPTIFSAKNSSSKCIAVKWNKNKKVTGYQIKYVTGSATKTITLSGSTKVSYTMKKLAKGKIYKIYVRSYKTVSGTKFYSEWSPYKSVKVSK